MKIYINTIRQSNANGGLRARAGNLFNDGPALASGESILLTRISHFPLPTVAVLPTGNRLLPISLDRTDYLNRTVVWPPNRPGCYFSFFSFFSSRTRSLSSRSRASISARS